MTASPIEMWPLFDGQPVDPAKCSGPYEDGTYKRVHNGNFQEQDIFLSGEKQGEGKFKGIATRGCIGASQILLREVRE